MYKIVMLLISLDVYGKGIRDQLLGREREYASERVEDLLDIEAG